jgi:hypothetical protein
MGNGLFARSPATVATATNYTFHHFPGHTAAGKEVAREEGETGLARSLLLPSLPLTHAAGTDQRNGPAACSLPHSSEQQTAASRPPTLKQPAGSCLLADPIH